MLTKRLERFTEMVTNVAIQNFKEKLGNLEEEKSDNLKQLIANLESEVMDTVMENEALRARIEVMSCHSCGN